MPPTSPHLLQCEETQDVLVIRFTKPSLRDDLDIIEIFRQLHELIEEQGYRKIVLGFQNVTSIASYFIGKLIETAKKLEALQGEMALCSLTPIVKEIIDLMHLQRWFKIYPTEQAALESFTG